MESCLHHPTRAIQTEHHVLQNVQLTSHFPGLHGWSLWRLYYRGLVGNLYGQPANPLLKPGNTQWTHLESSTMFPRTRNIPQTGKMHILSQRSGIFQDDSRKRRNTNGSCQTQGNLQMVPTSQCQSHTILSWILQLLLEVHLLLLQHCLPSPGPHQTVKPLDLGAQPGESLSEPTNCIHQTTNSSLPWYLQTFHPHDKCLTDSIRSSANAAQHQWRHTAVWLSLPDILPHWIKLWHLWSGFTHCNPQPWRMEAIPPRISLLCGGSYRS